MNSIDFSIILGARNGLLKCKCQTSLRYVQITIILAFMYRNVGLKISYDIL